MVGRAQNRTERLSPNPFFHAAEALLLLPKKMLEDSFRQAIIGRRCQNRTGIKAVPFIFHISGEKIIPPLYERRYLLWGGAVYLAKRKRAAGIEPALPLPSCLFVRRHQERFAAAREKWINRAVLRWWINLSKEAVPWRKIGIGMLFLFLIDWL